MKKNIIEWCSHHNSTLIDIRANGFYYMTYNGCMWYMSFDEM